MVRASEIRPAAIIGNARGAEIMLNLPFILLNKGLFALFFEVNEEFGFISSIFI